MPDKKTKQNQTDQLIKSLKDKVLNLEKRVEEVEKRNKSLEEKVTVLESDNIISQKVSKLLATDLDRLDQYHRRSNIIVSNVLKQENEKNEDVIEKVNNIIAKDLNLPNVVNQIDKLHHIGKTRERNGKKTRDIIIRFKSHRARYEVYEKRKSSNNIKIKPNLTKKRQTLRYDATQLVENNDKVDFAYADIHGDIKVRLVNLHKGKYAHNINSIEELEDLLDCLNN